MGNSGSSLPPPQSNNQSDPQQPLNSLPNNDHGGSNVEQSVQIPESEHGPVENEHISMSEGLYFGPHFILNSQRNAAGSPDNVLFNGIFNGEINTLRALGLGGPPPSVESTTILKSLVNLRRHSLKLNVEEPTPTLLQASTSAATQLPGHLYTLEFIVDTLVPCRIQCQYMTAETLDKDKNWVLKPKYEDRDYLNPVPIFLPAGYNQKLSVPIDLSNNLPYTHNELTELSTKLPQNANAPSSGQNEERIRNLHTQILPAETGTTILSNIINRVRSSRTSGTSTPGSEPANAAAMDPELGESNLTYPQDKLLYYPFVIIIEGQESLPINMMTPRNISSQYTMATFVHFPEDRYDIRVLKQKITAYGVPYVLKDIYGLSETKDIKKASSGTSTPREGSPHSRNASRAQSFHSATSLENVRECVICMSDIKDTIVLPCRHMCLCSDCAEELRYQSTKCPICRQCMYLVKIAPVNKKNIASKKSAESRSLAEASSDDMIPSVAEPSLY